MNRNTPLLISPTVPISRLQDYVLGRIVQQVREMCVAGWDWDAVVRTLACGLELNKLELVAWMQVLGKALLGEMPESHLSVVQFSAYLAKSLLNPAYAAAAWNGQSAAFKTDYQVWLSCHSHCTQLSSRQVHLQFLQLTLQPAQRVQPTCNRIVDSLLQETDPEPEEVRVDMREMDKVEALLMPQISTSASVLPSFWH